MTTALATGLINRLQNGAFSLCPEGTQTVADAATAFLNYTVLAQSGNVTTSQLSAPEAGQTTAARLLQASATAQRIGICQTLPAANVEDLRTAPINVTHRARFGGAPGARTMFAVLEWDGTANTSPTDPVNDWTSTSYIPGSFFKSTFTVLNYGYLSATQGVWAQAPYIPFQVNSGATNLVYMVWTETTLAQNLTLDVGLVQLARGNVPQEYEYRLLAIEQMIARIMPDLNIYPAAQDLVVNPTGNATATLASLNVQGTTVATNQREYLANFGLISNLGNGAGTPAGDKCTGYFGIIGNSGTGDIWAGNFVTHMTAASGTYNATGVEFDYDNLNIHYGDTAGVAGLAQPSGYGIQVTGAGDHRATAAIGIFGPGTGIWNRGVVVAGGSVVQSSFADYGTAITVLDAAGSHSYGVDFLSGTYSQAALRFANAQRIKWRNAAGNADINVLTLNVGDNITIGGSGVGGILCANSIAPSNDNSLICGQTGGAWASVTSYSYKINATERIDADGGYIFPSYTAAQIAAKANAINTTRKVVGKAVWDTTNNRLMVATGTSDVSNWEICDGSGSVTPA